MTIRRKIAQWRWNRLPEEVRRQKMATAQERLTQAHRDLAKAAHRAVFGDSEDGGQSTP